MTGPPPSCRRPYTSTRLCLILNVETIEAHRTAPHRTTKVPFDDNRLSGNQNRGEAERVLEIFDREMRHASASCGPSILRRRQDASHDLSDSTRRVIGRLCIARQRVATPLNECGRRQPEQFARAWSITVSFPSPVAICAYDSGSARGSFCHRREPATLGAQQC
jgi:hypothetical protein